MKRFNDMMLYDLLHKALAVKASGKTARYVVGQPTFEPSLKDVVYTAQLIRDRVIGVDQVETEDGWYSVTDYEFPTKVVELIDTARIFFKETQAGVVAPVTEAVNPFIEPGDYKTLSPFQVKRFFELYNEGQSDKIGLTHVNKFNYVLFSELGYLAGDKAVAVVNEEGKVNENIAIINGYASFGLTKEQLRYASLPGETSIIEWLVS